MTAVAAAATAVDVELAGGGGIPAALLDGAAVAEELAAGGGIPAALIVGAAAAEDFAGGGIPVALPGGAPFHVTLRAAFPLLATAALPSFDEDARLKLAEATHGLGGT